MIFDSTGFATGTPVYVDTDTTNAISMDSSFHGSTNYTEATATIAGALVGIDTALGSAGGGGTTPVYTNSTGAASIVPIDSTYNNIVAASNSVVSSGTNNFISELANGSVIGGGQGNRIGSSLAGLNYATISGGDLNIITSSVPWGISIGGGRANAITGADARYSRIGGGWANTITAAEEATISGGEGSTITADEGTIGGGSGHTVNGLNGTIGGGLNNVAGFAASVPGGQGLTASGSNSSIGGGLDNSAVNTMSRVGGGQLNRAAGNYAFLGGGLRNGALAGWASVVGGGSNIADGAYAHIGGGMTNLASGQGSTIPGGRDNIALGDYSLAAGQAASALHDNSYVWSDGSANATSQAANTYTLYASGGVWIDEGAGPFQVAAAGGGGAVSTNSYYGPASAWRSAGSLGRTQITNASRAMSYLSFDSAFSETTDVHTFPVNASTNWSVQVRQYSTTTNLIAYKYGYAIDHQSIVQATSTVFTSTSISATNYNVHRFDFNVPASAGKSLHFEFSVLGTNENATTARTGDTYVESVELINDP